MLLSNCLEGYIVHIALVVIGLQPSCKSICEKIVVEREEQLRNVPPINFDNKLRQCCTIYINRQQYCVFLLLLPFINKKNGLVMTRRRRYRSGFL